MIQLETVIETVTGRKTGEELEWTFSELRRKKDRLAKAPHIRGRDNGFLDLNVKCFGIQIFTGEERQDVIENCVGLNNLPAQHVYLSNGTNMICPKASMFLNATLNYVKLTTGTKLYGGVTVEKIDEYGKLSFLGLVVPILGNIRINGVYMKTLKNMWAKL